MPQGFENSAYWEAARREAARLGLNVDALHALRQPPPTLDTPRAPRTHESQMGPNNTIARYLQRNISISNKWHIAMELLLMDHHGRIYWSDGELETSDAIAGRDLIALSPANSICAHNTSFRPLPGFSPRCALLKAVEDRVEMTHEWASFVCSFCDEYVGIPESRYGLLCAAYLLSNNGYVELDNDDLARRVNDLMKHWREWLPHLSSVSDYASGHL